MLTGAGQTIEEAATNPFEKDGTALLPQLADALRGQSAEQVRRWPAEQRTRIIGLIGDLRGKACRADRGGESARRGAAGVPRTACERHCRS